LLRYSSYCIPEEISWNTKCGDIKLGANGYCPLKGSFSCDAKGATLRDDSVCTLIDEVYKCAPSKADEIIIRAIKRGAKNLSNINTDPESDEGSSDAMRHSPIFVLGLSVALCIGQALLI
jgi:hypothetical protein